MIGGEQCNITMESYDVIECLIGRGPAGSYDVIVNVGDLGIATGYNNASFVFTYLFEILEISPTEGGVPGNITNIYCKIVFRIFFR